MRPYKTSCCAKHVHYMVTFIGYFLCNFYASLTLCMTLNIVHYTTVIMLEARSKRGNGNDLYFQVTGNMWLTSN